MAWQSGFGGIPLIKRKVFISYHHGGDQAYYDAFSRAFSDRYDVITDNSLARGVESDVVEYVMRRIRENYITGSSCTIVLVGLDTWGRKYVDWEIDATLQKAHGLIGIQLPTILIIHSAAASSIWDLSASALLSWRSQPPRVSQRRNSAS
jgi:hypothetical protein